MGDDRLVIVQSVDRCRASWAQRISIHRCPATRLAGGLACGAALLVGLSIGTAAPALVVPAVLLAGASAFLLASATRLSHAGELSWTTASLSLFGRRIAWEDVCAIRIVDGLGSRMLEVVYRKDSRMRCKSLGRGLSTESLCELQQNLRTARQQRLIATQPPEAGSREQLRRMVSGMGMARRA